MINKNNRLRGQLVYMIGPIEYATDYGFGWRNELTPKLQEMGIGVMNPLDKPMQTQVHEDEELQSLKKSLIEKKDYDGLASLMKDVVRADLRMVDKADFLIAYIDMSVHMTGSYHEIVVSVLQRKPILIVCKQGKSKVSPWLYGIINHNYIFDNFTDMMQYLKIVDCGNEPIKGWHFFDFKKMFGSLE